MKRFNDIDMQSALNNAIDSSSTYSIEDYYKEYESVSSTMGVNADNFKISLNFVNTSKNQDPEYAKDGDSGFDIRANVKETMCLMPTRLSVTKTRISGNSDKSKSVVDNVELIQGETKIIPTGLFFEIPRGYEIQVRSRSGLSAKAQVVVTNSPGTIDSGYRGELKIILTNHGTETLHIKNGDRIAQCVFASVLDKRFVKLSKVDNISEDTDRGIGGLGSTGVE